MSFLGYEPWLVTRPTAIVNSPGIEPGTSLLNGEHSFSELRIRVNQTYHHLILLDLNIET